MSGSPRLSIVVPAYNEQDRLLPMLDAYTGYFLRDDPEAVEFIVVVNGSVDRTEEIARRYAASCPRVRVLVEPRRIGKGGAVLMGFREAAGARVGFTDADGATPPEAFDDLVRHIGDAGAIIANRWLPGADVSPPQPPARRIASRIFNGLVRLLFRLPISDTQCGAKLLSREALDTVLPRIGLTRWAFDVDLLWNLRAAGYAIRERPTTWHDVSGSKINVPKASAEMALALVRFRLIHSPFRFVVTAYDRTIGRWTRWPRGDEGAASGG